MKAWLISFVLLPLACVGQDLPKGNPADAGFSVDRLTRLEQFVDTEVERNRIPGALTVIARDGKVVHTHIAGYQDVESRTPLKEDTIFRIYSMTKPVIGVAVMLLVEDGKIKLSDPVSDYVPELAELVVYLRGEGGDIETAPAEPMIVQHLLTHTSGFSFPAGDTGLHRLLQASYQRSHEFGNLKEFVRHQAEFPLLFHPGARYEYGPSFDVLGHLIEVVTNQPLGRFLSERIFDRLAMVDTGFFVPADKVDRFASSYNVTDEGLELIETGQDSYMLNPNIVPRGGGGLASTAADYMRFAQMLLNEGELDGVRILSPTTVRFMAMNHLPRADRRIMEGGDGYGIGLGVTIDTALKGVLGNNGSFHWSGLERTHFWVDPRARIIGLFLTQVQPFNFEYDKFMRNLTYQAFLE